MSYLHLLSWLAVRVEKKKPNTFIARIYLYTTQIKAGCETHNRTLNRLIEKKK